VVKVPRECKYCDYYDFEGNQSPCSECRHASNGLRDKFACCLEDDEGARLIISIPAPVVMDGCAFPPHENLVELLGMLRELPSEALNGVRVDVYPSWPNLMKNDLLLQKVIRVAGEGGDNGEAV
jgi:hypothetical protein